MENKISRYILITLALLAPLIVGGSPQTGTCPAETETVDNVTGNLNLQPFEHWLADFKRWAVLCGVSVSTIDTAFQGIALSSKIKQFDRRQAEYNSTFFDYLGKRISKNLISSGRSRIKSHGALLKRIEDRYGVPPEVIVALWGLESSFGSNIGNTPVITALTTLAYDGRRHTFYQNELLNALRILDAKHINKERMVGSWAGAMGQPQFMPSTFLNYAADGNNDGRIDIWNSTDDALTSAANYLVSIGWRRNESWGQEVLLPPEHKFDPYQARLSAQLSDREWDRRSVRTAHGERLPDSSRLGSIILPAGFQGPAFLVYENFHVILEWNKSIFYALSVGHLSDRLAGKSELMGRAPPGDRNLRTGEIKRMQHDLNELGFDAGTPDGMVGRQTRQAIREYQRSRNLTADAYATPQLIARLRSEVTGFSGDTNAQPVDRRTILALQQGLDVLGYEPGVADGIVGPKTLRAMQRYLRDQDLPIVDTPSTKIVERVVNEAKGKR